MIEKIAGLPSGIFGVRVGGTLTRQDFDGVLAPLIEEATRDHSRMRCLFEIGPTFTGMTPGAVWEDVRLGLRSLWAYDGCAVVSDIGWIRESARIGALFMPCPLRLFGTDERTAAIDWLAALPNGAGVTHRLITESGVVVVEVVQPLRVQDFEALSLTIDPWLRTHPALQGLVLHAHAVPGWESLGSLVRHIRFVHDHHRRIARVALAVDGTLAAIAPNVAEHFVKAQLRTFSFDQLDAAIAWAASDE